MDLLREACGLNAKSRAVTTPGDKKADNYDETSLSANEATAFRSYVLRYEKKLKDKLDDQIQLAGLEALVPEELEKHLILNSNRLRTVEDAHLQIVTYVEAKFGLRIRDSKPSDTLIPW